MATNRATQDEEAREATRATNRAYKATEEARAATRARMATEEAMAATRARKATEEAMAATRERMATTRAAQNEENREAARAANRERMATTRATQYEEDMEAERAADRTRKTNKKKKRSLQPRDGLRALEVLAGTLLVPYIGNTQDGIGDMDVICPHCSALKFKNETPSMCCNSGKLNLQPFPAPPEPFLRLFRPDQFPDADAAKSKIFIKYIRSLNNGLCLSSLKMNEQRFGNYNPTVIVQGQVHQYAGPLQARDGETPVFAQLYVQDPSLEFTTRVHNLTVPANISAHEKTQLSSILQQLQNTLKQCNPYIKDFCQIVQMADEEMANGRLVISAKARPQGEHERRYNPQVIHSDIGFY